jgi:hypothetical protein
MPRTLAYSIGIAVLTGLLFGLAPALQASRADLQDALKEGGRGTTGSRAWLRNALVVAEVALSLLLLVGASLFVRSFFNLKEAALGFDTTPLMTLLLHAEREVRDARIQDAARRGRDAPDRGHSGVQAAFASNMIPLGAAAISGTS